MDSPARTYSSVAPGGLEMHSFPMRLWQKAKKLGTWDPQDIDFSQDREDWRSLSPDERETLLHLSSLFLAGEESVTLDLLPLLQTVASEGRLEEEMYLTSFLWEEAKHVELFRRFIDEVAQESGDLSRFFSDSYRKLFDQELPRALRRLGSDSSPVAQAEASVTYNLIVEGVMAETGYYSYHSVLTRHGIMPGMQDAVRLVKRDESRHLAYGVYLLSRLVAENGDEVWRAIQARMNSLLFVALGIIQEYFGRYDPMPFGLKIGDFTGYAMSQYQARIGRIERSRGASVSDLFRSSPEEGH